jgi:hypothetical protein
VSEPGGPEQPDEQRAPDEPVPDRDEDIAALARGILEDLSAEGVRPTEEMTPWEQLRYQDRRQDIELRRRYAERMLGILGAELFFVNLVFLLYIAIGVHWRVPGTTMQVWLSATVVQVVGIVYVVSRHLFPRRDQPPS